MRGAVALVLAAGLGTRLRPLTSVRAKPALPIGSDPLVILILRRLAAHGVQRVILNLHHLPESITRVVGDGSGAGVPVRYSWEDPILGSAGGPRRAFSLIEEDELLVVNGDTFTDVDLDGLRAAHDASGALVTLALTENPDPARYGGIRLSHDGAYAGTSARGTAGDSWHFVGVQMVGRDALASLDDGAAAGSIGGVYDALAAGRPGSVRGWITQASFFDIGTPQTYLDACVAFGGDVTAGRGCRIAASSQLSRSVLWENVVIEDEVRLTGCIVTESVVVPRGSRYHRAVLMRRGDAPLEPGDRVEGHLHISPLDA